MEALLIVDPQYDFMPGGNLPVPGGDEIIPVATNWIKDFLSDGKPVFISFDDHTDETKTHDGWPAHCKKLTDGWFIHDDIIEALGYLDGELISKGGKSGAYSAFEGKLVYSETSLHDRLQDLGVTKLYVMGLALDYCVKQTVLDGLGLGYAISVVEAGTRPVDPNTTAMEEMIRAGAEFI